MVVIRLSRAGAKKRPFYKIMVADRRKSRDGRYIENIGYYNPIATGGETKLHFVNDRLTYWIESGAKPTDRVKFLIGQYKTMPQPAPVKVKKTKQVEAEVQAAE